MANDSKIVITAGLQIPETVSTVEKELKVVGEKVSADRALKIVANVDLSKTTQRIQSQLTTLSKNLSLNLGGLNINSSAINTEVSSVVSTIQKTLGSAANIQLHVDNRPINEFVARLEDVGVGGKIIDQLKSKLESLNIVITKIVPQFTQLKGGEQQLTSFSITGLDKAGNTIEYLEKFNAETGDFEKSSTKMVSNLAKIQQETKRVEDSAKAAQLAYNDFLKLKGQVDLYSKKFSGDDNLKTQLADIQKLVAEFDNTQPVEKQRESIIRIDNALKIVKADIDAISKAASQTSTNVDRIYPNLSFNKSDSSTAILTDAKNQLNTFFNAESIDSTASRVKRAVEDASGSLQRFYVQIERGDKSVETLTYALNEQGNAYEYLGKVVREADNSTDFRRKGLDTQIEIQTQKVEQFAETVGKSQEATAILGNDIAKLREDISKVGDTNAMNAFLDNFDIAKAKFGAISAQLQNTKRDYDSVNKSINDNIKSLEKFNNSTVAKNNASNPTVASQTGLNADLINQLRGLQESLANDKSPENIARITARLNELGSSLKDATARSAELNQGLKDNDASAKFSAKLNNLKSQVEGFANTNRKATESLKQMRGGMTFAEEWQRIISTLRSGNLDANGIQRLTEDFRNFKGQASAAGITTSKFFTDMGNQIKMVVSRWISLYAIIGRVTSALNDLKSLDKTLTEIAKSSDVTRESLESLGNVSFDKANKYGRAASDYLYAVQEFSRAGFRDEQLEGLAEVSLLAQSAGDIETDLANSYVIATNAAYGYKGSVEELTEVLD